MIDKAQIFLKDITETGFYCSVDDTERLYIYEVINNVIQEWIKKDPKAKLLIDQWIYDYTDYDDRKVYGTSGNLEATYCNICTNKVYKIEDTKFKIFGNCKQFLMEDKPTLKEQLSRKTAECEKLKKELQAQRDFTAHEQKLIYCVAYDETCKTGNDCKQGKCIFKDNIKLKQTLTEIKEIAENMNNECFYDDFDCKDCDMQNGCTYFNKKQILQKISECEVNND